MPEQDQDRTERLRDLAIRSASGLVLAAAVLIANAAGTVAFAIVVTLVAALVFREWTRLVCAGMAPVGIRMRWLHLAAFSLGLGAVLLGIAVGEAFLLVVGATFLLPALWLGRRPLWCLAGVFYAGCAAIALVILRTDPAAGETVIMLLLAIVWLTDIGAYLVGSVVRGPKLWVSVSPGKTWSGALGGLVLVLVMMAAASLSDIIPTTLVGAIFLGAILGVTAQAGDLLESHIKRRFGAKDTGAMIPGHGGLMDRVDSLVAVSCVAVLVALAIAPGMEPASTLLGL